MQREKEKKRKAEDKRKRRLARKSGEAIEANHVHGEAPDGETPDGETPDGEEPDGEEPADVSLPVSDETATN